LSGKTEVFLHNIVRAICFKKPLLVKQLFGKKGVFLHHIVGAICFEKPVESLNFCQTIVRQNGLFFYTIVQALSRQFKKKIVCAANNLWNI
jgi:hypothetical protein